MPSADNPYPEHWYEIAEDDTLRQGDIFRNLLAFWLPAALPVIAGDPIEDETRLVAEWSRGDWIIMTASCDLHQRRLSHALLAQVLEATPENLKAPNEKEAEKYAEVVRAGLDPTKFMLSEYENIDPPFPRSIAYFRTNVFLPVDYLLRNCGSPRLRLRHPFREKFGNWVGQRMASVGPEDHALIPDITKVFPPHLLKVAQAEEERED